MSFPKVLKDDNGIRPAGPPDECFYCNSKVGEEHKIDCVTISKMVEVEFKLILPVAVPHSWTSDNINFRFNDSTWCADNLVDFLKKFVNEVPKDQCQLCDRSVAKYLRVIDVTPIRKSQREL